MTAAITNSPYWNGATVATGAARKAFTMNHCATINATAFTRVLFGATHRYGTPANGTATTADGALDACAALGPGGTLAWGSADALRAAADRLAELGWDALLVDPHDESLATGAMSLLDRKSTRLNSSHVALSRMPSSA